VELPSVTQLLAPLASVDDRGVHADDGSYCSWRQHIQAGAEVAALLRSRLDADRPPHVGVMLGNTPLFSAVLVAAALSGVVPVGLNPTRRGAALRRDITHADCQLILTDTAPDGYGPDFIPDGMPVLEVTGPQWAEELRTFQGAPVEFATRDPDDLFMLIFTSGTSGEPKAVRCTHEKVAGPGVMLAQRMGLGPTDVFYLSMPLFHSNAVMAGWAPAVAARGSIALRRKFSASQFIDDVRRFKATYANYVGKPMSYILATPPRSDDADNPLRIMYGNEGQSSTLTQGSELRDLASQSGVLTDALFSPLGQEKLRTRLQRHPRAGQEPLVRLSLLIDSVGAPHGDADNRSRTFRADGASIKTGVRKRLLGGQRGKHRETAHRRPLPGLNG
jgi:fatty-acyl-CoA synthase